MNKLFYLLLIFMIWSCTQNSETEKYQKKRNNIINARDNIKEIEINDVLISRIAWPYIIGDYLMIGDYQSFDKCIHIFNKNDFSYITSTADRGEGPNEISRLGHVAIDELNQIFYVYDRGKTKIYSFELDSVLDNPTYLPKEKTNMNPGLFPSTYHYINDTLCIGLIVEPLGNSDFRPSVRKWNMMTGEIGPIKYEHPEIKKRRVNFAVSMEHGIYAECYRHHDLITICTLDGELKFNIYGGKWDNKTSNRFKYYTDIAFCGDKIIALYSGKTTFLEEKNGGMKANYPTKFIVFDINGDYLQTLEVEYNIATFGYDKENNRIIMILDDEIQVGYLELNDFNI